ncbi:GNAT family N-acetyltransferase [Halomicrobium urmianum]|uniref:GNAT family N-acetyltransferase n=1 Tax=Halomicrobium urmianum TaxID=1586233 RepID=UPI001CD97312|nr:GNAT family N-acetyltransferase [Halomicrobium urmianum]
MATFRRLEGDEVVQQATAIDHAFGSGAGPPSYDGPEDVRDRIAERWGLFEDGALVSTCALYDLRATLAGERRPVGGFAAFATPPEHRAADHGERLQREALRVFRDRGYPYAALWPNSIPYYRRSGWGLVHAETEYRFPADALPSANAEGAFERLTPDDYERLLPAHEEWAAGYELALDRSARWWRERTLDDDWIYCWTPTDSRCSSVEPGLTQLGRTPADAEVPAGYVVFRLPGESEDGSGATMVVDELVYRTEEARRQLLELVRRHAPQVDKVRWSAPEETRLVHDAVDPKAVTATVEPGAMGRIVDLEAAIECLPAERTPERPVTVDVDDPLLPANDATIRIEPGPDGPTCEPTDAEPDVELGVGLLSKLYVGTLAPSTAADRGLLAATDDAVADLDALFPERPVYLTDFF